MNQFYLFLLMILQTSSLSAQEDLLSLLEDEPTINYATASFKTNRVINLHSLESTAGGVLDFKISHRFGFLNGGAYELFGLDNATIRLGLDYGLSNRLTVGIGRSSFEKTFDGFLKYKILRQSSGAKNMPFTLSILSTLAIKGIRFQNPDRDNYFSSRLFYTYQIIIGRKFNENFSLQISPTMVHRNLVETFAEENDVYAIPIAGRVKLSNRLAINAEFIPVLADPLAEEFRNSFSIGLDLETGGHVFQLHFTNSTSMVEKGFITETTGNWGDGGIHFGFNVSRVFTIIRPKSMSKILIN